MCLCIMFGSILFAWRPDGALTPMAGADIMDEFIGMVFEERLGLALAPLVSIVEAAGREEPAEIPLPPC